MLAGNAAGGLACLLAAWLGTLGNHLAAVVIYPSLLLIPFLVGVVAAWVWRPLELRIGALWLHSLSTTVVGLSAAFLCFHEGAICLVIVSPIIFFGILGGVAAGRVWFRKSSDNLNL